MNQQGHNASAQAPVTVSSSAAQECEKSTKTIISLAFYLAIIVILVLQGILQLFSLPVEVKNEAAVAVKNSAVAVNTNETASNTPQMESEKPNSASEQPQIQSEEEHHEQWNIALFFVIPVVLTAEMRLFLIVILCGALGSLAHAIRSFILFVGNKDFCKSWTLNYILRPFQGSLLGTLFYLVVRGGFFSPSVGVEGASPFGMAALAALVGLFSDSALAKLKEISIAVFAKAETAKNPLTTAKEKDECPDDQKNAGNESQNANGAEGNGK